MDNNSENSSLEEASNVMENEDVFMERSLLGKNERRHTKRQKCMLSNKRQFHENVEFIKVWCEDEKKVLLDLLYEHGDSDLQLLAAKLPHKHVSQIKTYLRTISRRAYSAEKIRKQKLEIQQLDKWIHIFKHMYGEPIDNNLPSHLHALSKNAPDTEFFNIEVNFQKAYEYLYTLTLGHKRGVDQQTYYFVHSYLEWFLNQFEKYILSEELNILSNSVNRLKASDSHITPDQMLHSIYHKILPQEQMLQNKYLLRTVCRKIRRNNFNRGDDYDRKIALLRAEVDEELDQNNIYLNPPPCELTPFFDEVKFKNLLSFLWAALFNKTNAELIECSQSNEYEL